MKTLSKEELENIWQNRDGAIYYAFVELNTTIGHLQNRIEQLENSIERLENRLDRDVGLDYTG